jgi:hypothetical protein
LFLSGNTSVTLGPKQVGADWVILWTWTFAGEKRSVLAVMPADSEVEKQQKAVKAGFKSWDEWQAAEKAKIKVFVVYLSR